MTKISRKAILEKFTKAAIITVEECQKENCDHCRHIMVVYNEYFDQLR